MQAIVTEATWESPTGPRTSRTTHADPTCVRASLGTVVAEFDTLTAALDECGWPCDWCIENTAETIVDTVEIAHDIAEAQRQADWERKTSGTGTGQRDRYPVRPQRPAAPVVDGVENLDRPNRYAGRCAACNARVAENAGLLAKRNGKFTVVHASTDDCTERTVVEPQPRTDSRPLPDVPAGRYAIPSTGAHDLTFYKVDRPDKGKWAGYTFVKVIAGPEEIRIARDQQRTVLDRITQFGVLNAAAMYGQEINRCSRCHIRLTDEVSRYTGLGPDCRDHLGVKVTPEMKAAALEMAGIKGWTYDKVDA